MPILAWKWKFWKFSVSTLPIYNIYSCAFNLNIKGLYFKVEKFWGFYYFWAHIRSICVWAKWSILKLERHNAGDIVKCTARNDYGIDEQIIKIIKIKQLTSPRFKTENPIISSDGKQAKLEWFPVEGANSYKVCSNNAKRGSILDGKT